MVKNQELIPKPELYFNDLGNDNIYVYCRVSKDTQDINKQFEQCFKHCKEANIIPPLKNVIFEKGISGGKDWRERELNKLKDLKKGNLLVVVELSRIGRDFLNTCHFLDLVLPKGCLIHEIKGDFTLSSDMDMNNRLKTMFSCMASEIERDNIKKRTLSAMQSDKVKAKLTNKLTQFKDIIIKYKEEGKNANQITDLLNQTDSTYNVNKSQVYKFIKDNKI